MMNYANQQLTSIFLPIDIKASYEIEVTPHQSSNQINHHSLIHNHPFILVFVTLRQSKVSSDISHTLTKATIKVLKIQVYK
jgi:hypothetical protein